MQANAKQLRKEVGRRIKVRRVELNLYQKDLGEAMGVNQTHVSGWETGTRALRLDDAVAIAKVLKTSVAYLAGEKAREAA